MKSSESTYDAIVIGSGPGGATVARQLSGGQKKVLILEKGKSVPLRSPLQDILSTASIAHLGKGATLVSGIAVGGTTMLYYATGHEPPRHRFQRLGIDLCRAIEEVKSLIPTAPLRDDLVGPMAQAICKSATSLGLDWQKLPKLIDQSALGQGCIDEVLGKRWRAGEFIREAVHKGASLLEEATVERILVKNGQACGVEYRRKGKKREAYAENIILAAGGIQSPIILKNSLKIELEDGFFCDPVIVVSGEVDFKLGDEPPMAFGTRLEQEGVLLADLRLPRSLFMAGALQSYRPDRLFSHSRSLSIMVKAADSLGGSLEKPIRKIFSGEDRQKLACGVNVAEQILQNAGARKLFSSRISSAHPGGSLVIGKHLDANLKTDIDNLYVCDGSILPAPWGLPPTTTIICLAMRLARHLLSGA